MHLIFLLLNWMMGGDEIQSQHVLFSLHQEVKSVLSLKHFTVTCKPVSPERDLCNTVHTPFPRPRCGRLELSLEMGDPAVGTCSFSVSVRLSALSLSRWKNKCFLVSREPSLKKRIIQEADITQGSDILQLLFFFFVVCICLHQ